MLRLSMSALCVFVGYGCDFCVYPMCTLLPLSIPLLLTWLFQGWKDEWGGIQDWLDQTLDATEVCPTHTPGPSRGWDM